MAVIAPTSLGGPGQRAVTETTCTSSDTLTYEAGDILLLRNPTGGALTPTIDGADGTTWPSVGIGNVAVSSGYSVGSIAAGAARAIPMDSIHAYLQGVITMTGGTGLIAVLLRKG